MKATLFLCLACLSGLAYSQIPAVQRGYTLRGSRASTVVVELFYDLLCDDSKANWAITRPLIELSSITPEQFGMGVTIFPLPYHHHAFFVATGFRAYMQMTMEQSASDRLTCMDAIFANQDNFLVHDAEMGETALKANIVTFFKDHCSFNLEPIFSNETRFREYNLQARYDWKYAASRTIHGTPSFVVNGFVVPDAGNYSSEQWIELIKNLLAGHDQVSFSLGKQRYHSKYHGNVV